MPLKSFIGVLIAFGVIAGAVQVGWGVWKQQPELSSLKRFLAVLVVLSPGYFVCVVAFYLLGRYAR